MSHIIIKQNCIYAMCSDNPPAMTVSAGATVVFETFDCFENQITREDQKMDSIDWDKVNPATGPLYIEDASPGDVLRVDIVDIDLAPTGVMAAIPGAGLFGDEVDSSNIRILPIRDGQVVFSESIHIPTMPMIGVIGVAPKDGAVPCGTPDAHGGNMDNKRIRKGSRLYLPVYCPGALLAIGDLHACMGDGEIMVTGVETAGRVTVKVDVIEGGAIRHPILEDENDIFTIASDTDLLTAVKIATQEMHGLVMNQLGLDFNACGMLLSAAGDVEVCQVVDPKLTVRFRMPKSIVGGIFGKAV